MGDGQTCVVFLSQEPITRENDNYPNSINVNYTGSNIKWFSVSGSQLHILLGAQNFDWLRRHYRYSAPSCALPCPTLKLDTDIVKARM